MIEGLAIVPADEKADLALLEGIADWCDRFTPLVATDPPDGLFLDITGVAHLFGGEAAMLMQVRGKIAAQGFAVQAAIAGTSLAARALARYANGTIALPGEEAMILAPLPIAALDCGEEKLRALQTRRPQDHRPGGGRAAAPNWRRGWAPISSPACM